MEDGQLEHFMKQQSNFKRRNQIHLIVFSHGCPIFTLEFDVAFVSTIFVHHHQCNMFTCRTLVKILHLLSVQVWNTYVIGFTKSMFLLKLLPETLGITCPSSLD